MKPDAVPSVKPADVRRLAYGMLLNGRQDVHDTLLALLVSPCPRHHYGLGGHCAQCGDTLPRDVKP